MKPFSNLNFLQLCVVMSMLGMMAVGVLFGLRAGGVPPWLLVVFGSGHPPAAQTEVIDIPIGTKYVMQERVKEFPSPIARISPGAFAKLQVKAPNPKITPLPKKPEPLALPAAPTSDVWQTLLAMFGALLLVGVSFRKSILPSRN